MLLPAGCVAEKPPRLESDAPIATRTTAEARAAFRAEKTAALQYAFTLPLSDADAWREAFWAMNLLAYDAPDGEAALTRFFAEANSARAGYGLQRWALEAAYGRYPDAFGDTFAAYADTVQVPKLYAMAQYHRVRQQPERAQMVERHLATRFPKWSTDPILSALHDAVSGRRAERPSLVDLFAETAPSATVVFSLHRSDRRQPGLALVRRSDGTFVRDSTGVVFHVSHLALAASNLPGTLTNGNTPQGILALKGVGSSDNAFIGPSPTLNSVLPFEAAPEIFLHWDSPGALVADTTFHWGDAFYELFLPSSWHGYPPIYEAYRAGEAGRSEIIAHGTTIDPAFTQGAPFSPNTPSLGCLTASERWHPTTGERLASDQQRLVEVARAAGLPGYLVVADLDDSAAPVSFAEVDAAIREAEARAVQPD